MIWYLMNAIIFDGAPVSLGQWREAFRNKFALIMHRAKPWTKALLKKCLSSF
jgi:hypothetical protein